MVSPPPVNIAVQPIAQAWIGKPVHMRVEDNGTRTLRVRAETVALNTGNHQCLTRVVKGITVRPETFTIHPYTGVNVTVFSVPAGTGDYGVLFVATAAGGGHKPVVLETAVGSQITTNGHLTCGDKIAVAANPVVHHAGFPLVPVLAVIVVAALALIAAVLIFGRRMQRRIHP
jgi:hypothetical protein